jgi:hypothetical protein
MGRSLLSIKLAFAFGICIAVLAGAAGQVRTAASERAERPSTQPSQSEATALEAEMVQPAAEVVCLWRACPVVLSHPLPATRTPSDARRPSSGRPVALSI